MSDTQKNLAEPQSLSIKEDTAKTNALVAYGLMAVGLFTGVFWIVGVIWAAVKREEAEGTRFADHYTNMIKTFWWGVGFYIVGLMLTVILIGYLMLFAVWLWSLYKIVKGLAKVTSNKAYSA